MTNGEGEREISPYEVVEKIGQEETQEMLDFLHQRRKRREASGQAVPEGIAMREMELPFEGRKRKAIVMGRSNGKGGLLDHTGVVRWLEE